MITEGPFKATEVKPFLRCDMSVSLPKSMAIILCKGHQKGSTVQETGDKMADQVAEQAVEECFNSRR